jgi:cytosine/adenosine deaminase-related metal-dependent hydrolase
MGLSRPLLVNASTWSVVFYEVLGLSLARARTAVPPALEWLFAADEAENCVRGLSPHAPYSVRMAALASWAIVSESWSLPVAIHLAETAEERQLLEQHSGPFVPFLQELGEWDPEGLISSFQQVLELFGATPHVLVVHGNYLDTSATILPGQTLVYCPRTHAAFGHAPHPLRGFLDRGTRIALGTDSLASNPDLDMLAEARFLHRLQPDLPGDVLLRMATLWGAEALGFGSKTGSLTPGKSADLAVIPIRAAERPDPHELLWQSDAPVEASMWRGKWIRAPRNVEGK